ncbi:unnamed protein product [Calypogeia fissa]
MDLTTLSRKELQALCKSNGIPANKTNAFMADALAKKRIPLSKMDANRDQKTVKSPTLLGRKSSITDMNSTANTVKSPTLLGRKNSNTDMNSTANPQQKPVLFQNNFLRRGKRKDAPTSLESDHSQGPPTAGATQVKSSKTETIGVQNLCRNQIVSMKAKVDSVFSGLNSESLSGTAAARESKMESRLKSGNHSGTANKLAKVTTGTSISSNDSASNGAKEKIEDRVRSQIDAALCSKVMKAGDALHSAPTSVESSDGALDTTIDVDNVDGTHRIEHLHSPFAQKEQQDGKIPVKLANREVRRLPAESPEQRMGRFSFSHLLACQTAPREENSSTSTKAVKAVQPVATSEENSSTRTPAVKAVQRIATIEENSLTSTPAVKVVQRSATLDLIAASPPISFSPLARQVEEKVRSIIERVQNFWKGSRDLAVVKSFGSPVQ